MADIKKELNDIKTAIYGKDVRGAIHDGIDKINKESEDSKQKASEAHDVMESIINDGFDNAALEANFEQKLDDKIGQLQPEWTQFQTDVTSQLNETEKHTEGALNVKSYDAKGDGVTDDTEYLQQMFIDAYRNKKSVKIPTGVYLISKPILVIADSNELRSSISIDGENLENVVIKCSDNFTPHLTEGILANKSAFLVVNESFLNEDNTFKNGSGSTHSVFINNLYLLCENNNVDYGILFPISNASSSYKRIRTRGFSKAGIKSLSHYYLNVLEKIRVDSSPISYDLRGGGVKTSVKLDSCYSVSASVIAYNISGIYMTMINCCADNCTGTVFDLTDYNGVVDGAGSESERAKITFKGGVGTHVVINSPFTFGNFTDDTAQHIFAGAGSTMIFNGGRILYDNSATDKIAPGALLERATQSFVKINNVRTAKYVKNPTYKDLTVTNSHETRRGNVHSRHGDDLTFIGFDSSEGLVDGQSQSPRINGNAIYFGFGTNPGYKSNGTDVRYHRPNSKGDILLSDSPKDLGGIGWVQGSDSQAQWAQGEYLKIPIIQSGTTAQRPTTNVITGQQYFDTTLGKPIWRKPGAWVDAMGNTV